MLTVSDHSLIFREECFRNSVKDSSSLAVVILARTSMAIELVVSVQNLTKIKQGRIALIQVDPKDMLTYDALREWRWHLSKMGHTLAAGRSLIILTALPKRITYNEESVAYKEVIQIILPAFQMQFARVNLVTHPLHKCAQI